MLKCIRHLSACTPYSVGFGRVEQTFVIELVLNKLRSSELSHEEDYLMEMSNEYNCTLHSNSKPAAHDVDIVPYLALSPGAFLCILIDIFASKT